MKTFFGYVFVVITILLVVFQVIAIDEKEEDLRFGYLLLLGILTSGSALAAASLLDYPERNLPVSIPAILLCLFVIGTVIYLVVQELDGPQDVSFWQYVFLLYYALGFGAVGVDGLLKRAN